MPNPRGQRIISLSRGSLCVYTLHCCCCHVLMDEGTLKTPVPKCRLYGSFLFGVVKQFCRFWISSETECKTPAEYSLQHNSKLPNPPQPPQPHTVCIYRTFSFFFGGGGGQREEGPQYTSIVPSSIGATVHKLGRKYQPWVNVSPVYKIC